MSRKTLLGALACALTFLGIAVANAGAATPVSLLLPQSTAFSFLGRSCGGFGQLARQFRVARTRGALLSIGE